MQRCLNTSTIRPQPLLDKIRIAAVSGYDGVELWINDIYEHIGRGGEVREIEQALADHGLTVPCTIAIRGWGEAQGLEHPTAASSHLEVDGRRVVHKGDPTWRLSQNGYVTCMMEMI